MAPTNFLIAGGTGRQGGAVVNALLKVGVNPNQVYVITRNSTSDSATRLSKRGIRLIQGTLDEPQSIFHQLQDVPQIGAFLAQAHGPTEVRDAKLFIDAAVDFNVQYLVYSSVDRGGRERSDRDPSYCKTFSDKFEIEQHLRTKAIDHTILRPTWFADNALWGFNGRLCMTGWRDNMGGKRMQVVVTADIGRWAVEAFMKPDGLRNEAISIASDELSFAELDEIFYDETGEHIAVTYGWLARFMIWAIKDLHTMFAWINERDYGADMEGLQRRLQPTTFREWVKESAVSHQKRS